MQTGLLRALTLLIAIMTVSVIVGCGETEEDPQFPEANLRGTNPPTGGEIAENGTLQITFDNAPDSVTVNDQPSNVIGKIAEWQANGLTVGDFATIQIEWLSKNGKGSSQTISLRVKGKDIIPPEITGGTVKNSETAVDSDQINTDGQLTVEFSEVVAGQLDLKQAGASVGWISKNEGTNIVLDLVRGTELAKETEYTIEGLVKDEVGNETSVKITFVTKAKEQ